MRADWYLKIINAKMTVLRIELRTSSVLDWRSNQLSYTVVSDNLVKRFDNLSLHTFIYLCLSSCMTAQTHKHRSAVSKMHVDWLHTLFKHFDSLLHLFC